MKSETRTGRTKRKRPEAELIWSHGVKRISGRGCRVTETCGVRRELQAEESGGSVVMRNGPQTSIHQLLVLLDHLYL